MERSRLSASGKGECKHEQRAVKQSIVRTYEWSRFACLIDEGHLDPPERDDLQEGIISSAARDMTLY